MNRKATTMVIPIHVESGPYREPTLEEMLSDSIVQAVMQADSVNPEELRALLGNVAHTRRLAAGADLTLRSGARVNYTVT